MDMHLVANDAAQPPCPIAVFARAPVAGAAKTRLIPRLGAQGAAALHARLVEHTLTQVCAAEIGPVTLWCSPDDTHPFFQNCAARFGVTLRAQQGDDLGQRMHHAFARATGPLLLVGTDCPMIGPDLLREAVAALHAGRAAVFCPAEDGGYGLVGLQTPIAEIFEAMAWGTEHVMATTRQRLAACGLDWHETAPVFDIDRPEDLDRLAGTSLWTPDR